MKVSMRAIRSLLLPRLLLSRDVTNQPSVYAGRVETLGFCIHSTLKVGHCISSLRVFSTQTAVERTVAPPPLTLPSAAVVAPLTAAMIRTLDVKGAAAFAMSLGVSPNEATKLKKEKVDGAAQLESTVEELRSYGVRGGTAHTIMRAVAPAIAEIKSAELAVIAEKERAELAASAERTRAELAASAERARAELAASAVTLSVYPPLRKKGANNPIKILLTPEDFRIKYALSDSPLQLVSKEGSVLRIPMTLEEAVQLLRQNPTACLRTVRSFGDDLESVNGFVANVAEALEQETTRSLVKDVTLCQKFGPLEAVNSAEHFIISWRSGHDAPRVQMEIDGLVLGRGVALLNSVKHSPTMQDVDKVISDAAKLAAVLKSHLIRTTTEPAAVLGEMRVSSPESRSYQACLSFPFSAAKTSVQAEAACHEKGVSFVRPDGSGFSVVLLE
jgi:hypothetical protein